MNHFPSTSWGKPRNESVDAYSTFPIHQSTQSKSNDNFSLAIQHTQQPIVTGTSVLGIKYKDGIMLAADNLGKIPFIPFQNQFKTIN
jgi:20S proteasome subunit beta 7